MPCGGWGGRWGPAAGRRVFLELGGTGLQLFTLLVALGTRSGVPVLFFQPMASRKSLLGALCKVLCPVPHMSRRQEFCHPKRCCGSAEQQGSPRLSFLPRSRDCPCCWRAGHCPGPGRPPHSDGGAMGASAPSGYFGPLPQGLWEGSWVCAGAGGKEPLGPGFEWSLSVAVGEPEQCLSDPGRQLL